ncbi:MAG: class I SAM-dependent methyltransferase [Candidatus Eisenbacteria bacterium]|uniref:Class I SAM-dependent methyltransferase n=1 Tax=Eiseniibacteriota bacterium TaxID=2212470 RepID=A0A948W4U1_UNCEI|nr:class I SAM-dependent methyltransferase [Candidatus Eisenbacteria bacterium]
MFSRLAVSNLSRVRNTWEQSASPPVHWWAIPRVRERWNSLITGESNVEFPAYVVNKYLKQKKNLRMISPGCGYGALEFRFAKHDQFSRVEGFDLSSRRIKGANAEAEKSNCGNLFYFVGDIYKYDFGDNRYDVIFLHSILHHVRNLRSLFEKLRNSLKSDGILIIDEYVGPKRFQWTDEQLSLSNYYLNKIPASYRRRWKSKREKKKIYRPGYLRMILSDPSEAVASEEIMPELRMTFKKLEERPYGGNLLQLIFKDISHNFVEDTAEVREWLNVLFSAEDDFVKQSRKSDYVFGVYGKP